MIQDIYFLRKGRSFHSTVYYCNFVASIQFKLHKLLKPDFFWARTSTLNMRSGNGLEKKCAPQG